MHRYELSYEYAKAPQTKIGEAPEQIDAHELLLEVLGLGKDGQIIGSTSLQHSLELMRFTNVSVKWQ